MGFGSSIKTLGAGFVWRFTPFKPAGRVLVKALSSGDDGNVTMAGMLLVRAGERSRKLLEQDVAVGRGSEMHNRVLKEFEPAGASAELKELEKSDDAKVAGAARKALSDLEIDQD